jgi:hypothetical protein
LIRLVEIDASVLGVADDKANDHRQKRKKLGQLKRQQQQHPTWTTPKSKI